MITLEQWIWRRHFFAKFRFNLFRKKCENLKQRILQVFLRNSFLQQQHNFFSQNFAKNLAYFIFAKKCGISWKVCGIRTISFAFFRESFVCSGNLTVWFFSKQEALTFDRNLRFTWKILKRQLCEFKDSWNINQSVIKFKLKKPNCINPGKFRARNLKEYLWMKLPSFHFGVLTFK